jgi:hypothetical protein
VAAWVPDMFGNFYKVKNHKIVNKSTTTEEKKKHTHGTLEIYGIF